MIAALTCTGGRPEALALCRKYVERQVIKPDLWVLVDDCEEQTATPDMGEVIRPWPFWRRGEPHTLPRNMIAGLSHIAANHPEIKVVTIFEDDDWYHPTYLGKMTGALGELGDPGVVVVGEMNTFYYNVVTRTWKRNLNPTHASLCSVSFHASAIPQIIAICEDASNPYIDLQIFRNFERHQWHLESSALCIGIKGMPGLREGQGGSHRGYHSSYRPDPTMEKLEELIGREDAEAYAPLFKPWVKKAAEKKREQHKLSKQERKAKRLAHIAERKRRKEAK